jgi:polysaccharide biosynthesis protein PslG
MHRSSYIPYLALLVACLLTCGLALAGGAEAGPAGGKCEAGDSRPDSRQAAYTAASASTVGERFGVASSHIANYDPSAVEAELNAADNAGAAWLRYAFAWHYLEPVQGAWNLAGADLAVEEAQERGIEVLGILGGTPYWANGGNAWNWPPTDMAAWEDYVSVVVSRYRGKVAAWEIWNEQNLSIFWQPEPDAEGYVALLAAASAQIRAADPEATIVMGGVAGLGDQDLGDSILEEYLSLGAAEYIDAIAYHPYAETIWFTGQPVEDRLRPKESLNRYLVQQVHSLVSEHTEKDLQVWITEVGWTTSAESTAGVDRDTQASYLLRTLINFASTDVDRVIWFNLRDTQENDTDYYGLLAYSFTTKPSFGYYSVFQQVFGPSTASDPDAATFSCESPSALEAHCFRLPDGGLAIAAWKSDDTSDSLAVTIPDPSLADPVSIDPASGNESSIPGVSRDAGGNISVSGLAIGKTPVILRLYKKGSGPETNSFYFAEGYTGAGFQEYLCVGNTGIENAEVDIEFLLGDGSERSLHLGVPPGSRSTVDVNSAVGAGVEVAMVVSSLQAVVAERPMYFSYGDGWTGGHVAAGAREPSSFVYFAEGYTGEGFEEWICVLNPNEEEAGLTLRFQTEEEGEKVVRGLAVGPRSRASFKANELLGGQYQASCAVESTLPVVAERPVYFDYRGRGDHHWQGGHCVIGAPALANAYFFAEGTTRVGFEEWLTLQNPAGQAIEVEAVYHFGEGQGDPARKSYRVEGGKRLTVYVPDEVGMEKDVSVELSSPSAFLAERPMYFDYTGMGAAHWRGGDCVIGAGTTSAEIFFAEGYTGGGYHEWLCLQNPGFEEALVEVVYLTQEEGALPARMVSVPARTRVNLFVNEHAGAGYQLSCRLRVISGTNVVAERPMYFGQGGSDGGHSVVGFRL